jgi:hypothetical protein
MLVPITGLYAAILAILLILLTLNVIRLRYKHRVGIGDGGAQPLQVGIRIHGNFTEYMPMCLLLMALVELNGGNSMLLHGSGIFLVLGRLAHAVGLTQSIGPSIYRQFGILSMFAIMLLLSGHLLINFIG